MYIALAHAHRLAILPRRGLSIVEMLVGIAVGMFVLAGATLLTSSQLADNRFLLLETQIQQDLRATADIVTRELRRSGYWNNATTSTVWSPLGASAPSNGYQTFSLRGNPGAVHDVTFAYSKRAGPSPLVNAPTNAELFGYRLNAVNKTIEARMGAAGWQTLTDPTVLVITQFDITPVEDVIVVPCASACPGGGTACWPQQSMVNVTVEISGQAAHDPNVKRSVQSGVRIRNDRITGVCPS
jgi:type IV pilus assembly protein PilW